MHKGAYYIINAITVYRLLASVLLLYFIVTARNDLYKWFLAFSFLTDLIDGWLARKYKVVSVFGAKLDSMADDLTFLMAAIGIFVFQPAFILHEIFPIAVLLILYVLQVAVALARYGRMSSFHTYLAKFATLLQGTFFILLFFLPAWPVWLFHIAVAITVLDLIEEIILVVILPEWQPDVKGLYWVLYSK